MTEAPQAPDLDQNQLEEEGDIAADYLEELLDIADIDGDIDIEIRNGRNHLSVVTEEEASPELEALIGDQGQVLDALQELLRLAVLASSGQRSRLILDIANFRANRQKALVTMAEEAIAQAKESGQEVHLEPLGSYERKLIHDIVASHGLYSESEGSGSNRHIVISLLED